MTDTHTTAHIPDEAVQAREKIEKIAKYFINEGSRDYTQEICYALKNVGLELLDALNDIPHLSAPCAVEVKQLEWHNKLQRGEREGFICSTGGILSYSIMLSRFRVYGIEGEHDGAAEFKTLDEAKAAAQADFERHILSCVVTKPVDVAAVRRQAFEEAAKVAETVWPNSGPLDVGHGSRIAAAIRALSAEPAHAEQTCRAALAQGCGE
ncbi:hypothetical protein [Pseudochrobactrum sp. B5]|uniref:hypothetical protein n=1 Tax=Pseudochrobactrum sp. B5 TaxID=1289478 RepID=UPI0009528EC1|nr:hypothetical protein [Pseudochrobactrum sp. B5]